MDEEGAEQRAARKGGIGLSGKLLLLTILFVMLSEVLIFVPSIANFRMNWLRDQLGSAEVAALVFEAATEDMISGELQLRILDAAGAKGIALKRPGSRQLLVAGDMPPVIDDDFDIRDTGWVEAISAAFEVLFAGNGRVIRVVGPTNIAGAEQLEIVLDETPLRQAMLTFGVNILTLSIIISMLTAALVYLSLNWLMIRPMRRLTRSMVRFSEDPEDHSRIVRPCGRTDEIGVAENELAAMQQQLAGALHQKGHLAALGLAVAKINHDLRNILANAQLISDRLSLVQDPAVQRSVPKLIASLDRAIELCSNTIKYGRAREAPPERRRLGLAPLAEEVADAVGLKSHQRIGWENDIDPEMEVDADPDHLYRVLMNLCRNSMEALERDPDKTHAIRMRAERNGATVTLTVSDTGPGIPAKARKHLFKPFQGSLKPGGTGLGLAIASELIRSHGGGIRLVEEGPGAVFCIDIPDGDDLGPPTFATRLRLVDKAGRRAS